MLSSSHKGTEVCAKKLSRAVIVAESLWCCWAKCVLLPRGQAQLFALPIFLLVSLGVRQMLNALVWSKAETLEIKQSMEQAGVGGWF